VIVVSGLMRSGTSVLAKMLHTSGVPMGEVMRFPPPGGFTHLEWEDASFSDALAARLAGKSSFDLQQFFETYISRRSESGIAWGVKSPFVLPYLRNLRNVADELGMGVDVVLTERPFSETMKSLERLVSHLGASRPVRRKAIRDMEAMQKVIAKRWDEHARDATVIEFSRIESDPDGVKQEVCDLAGVENRELESRWDEAPEGQGG